VSVFVVLGDRATTLLLWKPILTDMIFLQTTRPKVMMSCTREVMQRGPSMEFLFEIIFGGFHGKAKTVVQTV
jgi:hypothetical protein